METIKITKKRMEEILPDNIKQTDVLTNEDKKVLACMLNYFISIKKAQEDGYVAIPNNVLQESVKLSKNKTLESVNNLIMHELIEKKSGGIYCGKKYANTYKFNWDNLEKPLKKLTFKDLISMCKPKTEEEQISERKKLIEQLKKTYKN